MRQSFRMMREHATANDRLGARHVCSRRGIVPNGSSSATPMLPLSLAQKSPSLAQEQVRRTLSHSLILHQAQNGPKRLAAELANPLVPQAQYCFLTPRGESSPTVSF